MAIETFENLPIIDTGGRSLISALDAKKISFPNDGADFGNSGDQLRSLGNGGVEWAAPGMPTYEQTEQAISDWLNAHPEATTTVEDGAITDAKINDALKRELVYSFETITDTNTGMKYADNLVAGMVCHTNGFHASGDGGAAWYEISATGTANGMDVIACGELFAKLIVTGDSVTPEMFGAWGDDTHDETSVLQYIFDNYNSYTIVFNNVYNTKQIRPTKNFSIDGNGTISIDNNYGFIYIPAPSVITLIKVKNITVKGNALAITDVAVFDNSSGCEISNVVFDGVNFIDVSFGIYLNATQGGIFKNAVVCNCSFYNIVGTASGSGLGVAAGTGHDYIGNLQIVNNHFERCGRHSIYVSNGYNVVVSGNTINEHGYGYGSNAVHAALNIGRCNDVIVTNNIVSNYYSTEAMRVFDENMHTAENVLIENNIIYGSNGIASRAVLFNSDTPSVNGSVNNISFKHNIIVEGEKALSYLVGVNSGLNVEIAANTLLSNTSEQAYKRAIDINTRGELTETNYIYIRDNVIVLKNAQNNNFAYAFGGTAMSSNEIAIIINNNIVRNTTRILQNTPTSDNFKYEVPTTRMPRIETIASGSDVATVLAKVNELILAMRTSEYMA